MGRAFIVLVERKKAAHTSFAAALAKRYDVVSVLSGKQAATVATEHGASVIILDAISLNSPGDRIAKTLKQDLPKTPLIHLMTKTHGSAADMVLAMPFTARKIVNAIERVLAPNMPKQDNLLNAGPFAIDTSRRLLLARGQETQLTPKLALLVEYFLRHPGETLDRKQLMEHVWQTDYLGDTRTLDVHIRWFRRAIEMDPARPQYLKTVRGVGYKLEIAGVEEPI